MNFYENIARYYEYIFPLNIKQVDFIKKRLKPELNPNLIELGCATGTLLKDLSMHYNKLSGIDLDERMIKLANEKEYSNPVKILAGNMLEFPIYFKEEVFDGIICFGNTLVHLNNIIEIENLLRKTYNKLNSGGKLLIQIINYDRILQQKIDSLPIIDNEAVQFVRKYNYLDDLHLIEFKTTLTIKAENTVLENSQMLYPLVYNELYDILRKVGFENVSFFGSFDNDTLSDNSIPLIAEVIK